MGKYNVEGAPAPRPVERRPAAIASTVGAAQRRKPPAARNWSAPAKAAAATGTDDGVWKEF
jgi:hypothetical protein